MREFVGKTAFVTGGAAGIGLALGRAFARSGMKVMLADIETDALQAATALQARATALVTNDPVFERVDFIETLLLDDVL